jgi:hypothetical protein
MTPMFEDPGLDGRAAGHHRVAGTAVEAVVGEVLRQSRLLCNMPFSVLVDADTDPLTNGQVPGGMLTLPYSGASVFIAPRLAFYRASR